MSRFRSTVLLAAATFACHGVAFLNNVLTSKYFGTSVPLDGFWLAMLVTTTLMFYVEPFKEVSLVSVKSQELQDRLASERSFSGILNLALVSACGMVLLSYLALGPLVRLFTPEGFDDGVAKLGILILVLLPLCILETMGTFLEGYLTIGRHFLAPKAATLAGLLAALLALLLFHDTLAVMVMVVGVYLVSGARIAGMMIAASQSGFRYVPTLRVTGLSLLMRQFWPLLIVQLGSAAVMIVLQKSLSSAAPGGLSAYNYAFRVWALPLTLLGASVSAVLWPDLIENARRDVSRLWDSFFFPLRLTLAALTGIGVLLFCLATPIVYLVFERGAFTPESRALTVTCLRGLAMGLPFWGLHFLCTRGLLARRMNQTLLALGLGNGVVIVLSLTIARNLGVGLGPLVHIYVAGNALTAVLYLLRFYTGSGTDRCKQLTLCLLRFAAAAGLSIVVFSGAPNVGELGTTMTASWAAVSLGVTSSVIGLIYVGTLYALGEREVVVFAATKLRLLRAPRS